MRLALITSIALFLTACNTNTQRHDEDLCNVNLNKINDYKTYDSPTMGEPKKTRIHELKEQAERYRQQGDIKNCIAVTEHTLNILKQYNSK